MNKDQKIKPSSKTLKLELIYGLIHGFAVGTLLESAIPFSHGLIVGLTLVIVLSLVSEADIKLFPLGFVFFFILSGTSGLVFVTNLWALLLDNPDFVMFDLVSSGIALLIIQVVGWTMVWRLRNG